MFRLIKILLSLPRTILFNLRYLPTREAIKLPVWIACNVRINRMHRGAIKGNLKRIGQIRIGYHEADAVDTYSSRTILDIHKGGVFQIKNDAHIGHGAHICIKPGAVLSVGSHFAISGTTSIICSKKIIIGDDVQFSWDSLVMDSDAHKIIDCDGELKENTKPITIGSHVWIAAKCTILKGSIVPDNCVVGVNSLVNKKFYDTGCIIAGSPARELGKIGGWEL